MKPFRAIGLGAVLMLAAACQISTTPRPTSSATAPPQTEAPGASSASPTRTETVPSGSPTATPCAQAITPLVPALVYQNGNLDLGAPFALGSVSFFLAGCRDIQAVRAKYGLGPASLVITEPGTGDIRTRYFRAAVPIGQEAAMVTRLAAHPEDFQYVEFDMVPHGCGLEAPDCHTNSDVTPREGPVGTSFAMTICCWTSGTSVIKTFTTPSGQKIVLNDIARANQTVPAGWGGSNTDERGTYTVFVRDDKIGALVRFRIT